MAIPDRLTTGPTPGNNTAGLGVDLIAVDSDSCCDGHRRCPDSALTAP
ncbi:hypothetical protein I546_4709 [Mycobacterium kansasii 732]|nr:hypothetical protein I546_4709 [Mycobacterium kansasii 732]